MQTLKTTFILGWIVPLIAFASVMGYYNIWKSKAERIS
jgi:hypothetical protein